MRLADGTNMITPRSEFSLVVRLTRADLAQPSICSRRRSCHCRLGCPDDHPDRASAVLAGVRLRRLAPAVIEQRLARRTRETCVVLAVLRDAGERLDAELGMPPRQRPRIGWKFLSRQMLQWPTPSCWCRHRTACNIRRRETARIFITQNVVPARWISLARIVAARSYAATLELRELLVDFLPLILPDAARSRVFRLSFSVSRTFPVTHEQVVAGANATSTLRRKRR